jgi:hypothetical protein
MEDGQICEMGSHREVVEASGTYAALWESWHGARRKAVAADAGQVAPRLWTELWTGRWKPVMHRG